jgi:hypothetical protein
MLYNVAPPNVEVGHMQQNRIQLKHGSTTEGYHVDDELLHLANQKNPDPAHLYPFQINSCQQLHDRVAKSKSDVNTLLGALDATEAEMLKREQESTADLNPRILAA